MCVWRREPPSWARRSPSPRLSGTGSIFRRPLARDLRPPLAPFGPFAPLLSAPTPPPPPPPPPPPRFVTSSLRRHRALHQNEAHDHHPPGLPPLREEVPEASPDTTPRDSRAATKQNEHTSAGGRGGRRPRALGRGLGRAGPLFRLGRLLGLLPSDLSHPSLSFLPFLCPSRRLVPPTSPRPPRKKKTGKLKQVREEAQAAVGPPLARLPLQGRGHRRGRPVQASSRARVAGAKRLLRWPKPSLFSFPFWEKREAARSPRHRPRALVVVPLGSRAHSPRPPFPAAPSPSRPLSKTVRFNVVKVIPSGKSSAGGKAFAGF